jgi:NAD(P)-dependent dehydrogenase (short-subunit alcohol dehydrogenase family)
VGKAIALEMAAEGANVFFTDIDDAAIANVEQALKAWPIQSRGYRSDIAQSDEVDSLWKSLSDNGVQIDILVHTVKFQHPSTDFAQVASADWRKTYETNIFGPMHLTRLAVQAMKDRNGGGSIIFTTSIHQWSTSGWVSYSSSKTALGMIIKELALELAPHSIRVNGIAPGAVGEDEHGMPLPHSDTPLHRTKVSPLYVGRAAVYLASEYFSRHTTGTVFKIDGGLSLHHYMRQYRER